MNKYILKIEGMRCSMCESHVNDAIRKKIDAKKIKSSHTKNETIIITDKDISDDLFYEILNPTGYKLTEIKKEDAKKIGPFWK
ncbi:MAG: heavy-metal-associated domain-containing protein [Acholeplasmatales bacterium]|nr:heavy-metal-associated domain-containing protein [Acholeplasmatales bacterium]